MGFLKNIATGFRKKRIAAAAALALSFLAHTQSAQAESAQTKELWREATVYYNANIEGKKFPQEVGAPQFAIFCSHVAVYLQSLADDTIQLIKLRKFKEAKEHWEQILKGRDMLKNFGAEGMVNKTLARVEAVLQQELKIKEGKAKRTLLDLPDGTWTFKSSHFNIQLKVGGGRAFFTVATVNVFLASPAEWQAACKGKSQEVVQAVENYLAQTNPEVFKILKGK